MRGTFATAFCLCNYSRKKSPNHFFRIFFLCLFGTLIIGQLLIIAPPVRYRVVLYEYKFGEDIGVLFEYIIGVLFLEMSYFFKLNEASNSNRNCFSI